MLRILRARKIFSNGLHNAFTDIAFWSGHYYVAFRTGAAHSSLDGRITVLRSVNLEEWEKCTTLEAVGYERQGPQAPAH